MSNTLIEFRDIYKIYDMGDAQVRAIDGISMSIGKKEMVAIIGQSGSGKSTCMNIMGCLDIPTSGQYYLAGQDVSALKDDELAEIRNRSIGFIFQQYNLIAKLNVLENVELPLIYAGVHEKKRIEIAMEMLERVGIANKRYNFPNQLSGGQQQRVSIARALAGHPPIILADEPTGALDSRTGEEILELMKKLNEEGNTIILITHDSGVAGKAKRIIRISDGRIIDDSGRKKHPRMSKEEQESLMSTSLDEETTSAAEDEGVAG